MLQTQLEHRCSSEYLLYSGIQRQERNARLRAWAGLNVNADSRLTLIGCHMHMTPNPELVFADTRASFQMTMVKADEKSV